MRYKIKGQPPLSLFDLLKKRRITLEKFTKDFGITTHTTLAKKCESIGVSPPSEEEFKKALGGTFSSPQEGIVVLDPPTLTKDDGTKVSVDEFLQVEDPPPAVEEQQTTYTYRSRKKKSQDSENQD